MNIAVGDLGGSNLRMGVSLGSGGYQLEHIRSFKTSEFSSLSDAIQHYQSLIDLHFDVICLGVAGPVLGGRAKLTNLPWNIDAKDLVEDLDCLAAYLLNDLEAHSYGLPWLSAEDCLTIQQGQKALGNQAFIAAGTGLGEAQIFWDGKSHTPFATEGGHCSFSPSNAEELALLDFLWKQHDAVSWERVLSGGFGFRSIVEFYGATQASAFGSDASNYLESKDALGPVILNDAQKGSEFALKVVECFVRLYGSEAGNLALKSMALGGIYIGGSIAIGLQDWMVSPLFLKAFSNKGRFSDLLRNIPVTLVTDTQCSLKGALRFARLQKNKSFGSVDIIDLAANDDSKDDLLR